MAEHAGSGYVVSAVNRKLMQKGALVLIGAAILVAALMVILPTRYYFGVHHGSVTLYAAKISGFIPSPVPGYSAIPVGSQSVKAFAKRNFTDVKTAVAALREFLQAEIAAQADAVTAKEKEIAALYESYVPNLAGANMLGIEGLDQQVQALQAWMQYHQAKAVK